ncbi:MAG: phosphate/phosphite/phosphonate ABC transporter substrate-binding protein, partial [Halobacteriales archaeon]|nr:phosphate/phosphite/phosphonate ABC transporter substrate-binding protein [Halobacteriales archaeon]
APVTGLGSADEPIVISFVPSGETAEITTGGEQIAELLGEETGLAFESNVATAYAAVIESMGAENTHVGFLNTFSYILAHEKHDVDVILVAERFGSTTYQGQIITRADSGIESIDDLRGVTFCRPDPLSTSGWIIPSVMLQAEGLNPEEDLNIVDAGGHDGVVRSVYNEDCDAGATYVDARGEVEEELTDVMDEVVVIATTDEIPNDNVSVIPELSDDLVQTIRDGLLAMLETEAGQEAMETVYGIEALEPAEDTFYDEFRTTLDRAGVEIETLTAE